MTDLATVDTPSVSTTLETDTSPAPSGGGAPRVLADEAKEPAKDVPKPSLRDIVAEEAKNDAKAAAAETEEAKADKGAEKAPEKAADAKTGDDTKEAPKAPERGPDGKFAAKEAQAEAKPAETPDAKAPDAAEAKPEARPNGHIEAPKSFLPDAKETWRNTPRAVQRDVENAFRQHETEIAKHREAAERYEPLRQWDEYVRQNGRPEGLTETLREVAQLEDMVSKNPIAALNQVLLRAGPRKADGSPVNLYELAQYVVQSGQDGYDKMVAPPQQANTQREDPRIAELQRQLAQVQEQTLAQTVIEPFKAQNPRYDELEQDIALFLRSGKIPTSLSPSERLAAAYDMAVRINPASHANDADASQTDLEPARRADDTFSAGKSIKSAPGAVSIDMEPDRGGSIRDLLADELRRTKRS